MPDVPGSFSSRLTRQALTRLTLAGLGVVLAMFALLSITGAVRGADRAAQAKRSGDLAAAYLRAQDALSREDTVEDVIKHAWEPRHREEFRNARSDFDHAMATLQRVGGPQDRELARRASALHARYAAAMNDVMSASERGDLDAAEEINDERMDPAQDELQPLINGVGPRHAVAQLAQIDELEREQRSLLKATLVVVPAGGALYVLLLLVFGAYRRRLDRAARAELARLSDAAHTDSLTGLPNRRALRRDLEGLDGGAHVVGLLDVAGLKQVNDRRGHLAGDELLADVASALAGAAAGRGQAYRIGGDEFALVLSDVAVDEALAAVAAARSRVVDQLGADLRAGLAGDAPDVSPEKLLCQASSALVGARRLCRSVVVYAPDLDADRAAAGCRPG